jgi:asparagine synthase (glutamine-hydrolysing)
MCGISGYITFSGQPINKATLKTMTDVIEHRGPDGEGHWLSDDSSVGLGHRRLSIIDLSHAADQPMHYMGRFTIVFNGEIYNYIELKETLLSEGYTFATQSDTEVLMALYHKHGKDCLSLLDGMFAFAIYDKEEKTVFCARDRFGEKPFFYEYIPGKHFVFGSEMKCLWAAGIEKRMSPEMMYNYLTYGYLEDPVHPSDTFYSNVKRLLHSHFAVIDLQTQEVKISKYFQINYDAPSLSLSFDEAKEKFNDLFETSVKRRLRSDVPVGSSLSGGLDSSLVVCTIDRLIQNSSQEQNTFSAVFPGFAKDERKYIDYVIAKTKVKPHFVTPNEEKLAEIIEKLSYHQEEPYGSGSIYVQYCVMQLAKQQGVTVLLDGQGADEILAGYHPYFLSYFNELKKQEGTAYRDQFEAYTSLHQGNAINGITKKGKAEFVRDWFPNQMHLIKKLYTHLRLRKHAVYNTEFVAANRSKLFETPGSIHPTLNTHLHSTTMDFGLQQLLRYADRNSMAHSREVRLPFLNHELVEFLYSLPAQYKISKGWTKYLMREASEGIMPKEIAWRTDKIGYEPPQSKWMTTDVMKNLLMASVDDLKKEGYLTANKSSDDIALKSSESMQWQFIQAAQLI